MKKPRQMPWRVFWKKKKRNLSQGKKSTNNFSKWERFLFLLFIEYFSVTNTLYAASHLAGDVSFAFDVIEV